MVATNKKRTESPQQGRLNSRPSQPSEPGPRGLQELEIPGSRRPALVYVPQAYSARQPAPLAVMFHGAGGGPHDGLALLQAEAEASGLLLLAPGSRSSTWDVIAGGYGTDVRCVDEALAYLFAHYAVDVHHLAIGGFSDGASYALSLGVTNGQLFTHILAFSPGFMAPTRVFISHGTEDPILPIQACSRRLAPALEQAGYEVCYREFSGEHAIPKSIRTEAMQWFLGAGPLPHSPGRGA